MLLIAGLQSAEGHHDLYRSCGAGDTTFIEDAGPPDVQGAIGQIQSGIQSPYGAICQIQSGIQSHPGAIGQIQSGIQSPHGGICQIQSGIQSPPGAIGQIQSGIQSPHGVISQIQSGIQSPPGAIGRIQSGIQSLPGAIGQIQSGIQSGSNGRVGEKHRADATELFGLDWIVTTETLRDAGQQGATGGRGFSDISEDIGVIAVQEQPVIDGM